MALDGEGPSCVRALGEAPPVHFISPTPQRYIGLLPTSCIECKSHSILGQCRTFIHKQETRCLCEECHYYVTHGGTVRVIRYENGAQNGVLSLKQIQEAHVGMGYCVLYSANLEI